MANSWKKITDKIDKAPVSGPHASDWEAMNAKIAAHPSVGTPKGKGGFWFKLGFGVLILGVLGLSVVLYNSNPPADVDEKVSQTKNRVAEPSSVSNESKQGVDAKNYSSANESKDEVSHILNTETEKQEETIAEIKEPQHKVQPDVVFTKEKNQAPNTANEDSSEDQIQNTTSPIVVGEGPVMSDSKLDEPTDFESENTEQPIGEELAFATGEQASVPESQSINNEEISQPAEPKDVAKELENIVTEPENNESLLSAKNSEEVLVETSEEPKENDETIAKEPQSLVSAGESEPSSPADPVNLRSAGFRLNGLNIGGGYSTDFSGNLYGVGVGVDVDIQRGGLLLNTGVHYYQMNTLSQFIKQTTNTNYSTRYSPVSDTVVTLVRDSAWVIDSAFAGHWADKSYTVTNIISTTDTINDSTVTKIETKEKRRVKLSYLELPVLAGHRFRFNRFAVDVYGGVILNQLTTGTVEGIDIEKKFGLDAVLQPAIRYYIKPQWSVFTRAGLRYGIVANEYRPQKLYSNFQIGLTYHW